jgi:putative tryptophan/tyrosine transport system substrate-binding protein
MKRRDFIKLLGGAATWPLAARAQQPDRLRRIGILMNWAADNPEGQDRLAAFHQGLQELGWNVGRNVRIEHTVTALQHISRTLPIVFAAVADPVDAGIVDSLAHPGNP